MLGTCGWGWGETCYSSPHNSQRKVSLHARVGGIGSLNVEWWKEEEEWRGFEYGLEAP